MELPPRRLLPATPLALALGLLALAQTLLASRIRNATGVDPVVCRHRKVEAKTPWPCKEKYDDDTVKSWVEEHLSKFPMHRPHPQMLLMMGGSGAGKGTFVKKWAAAESEFAPDVENDDSATSIHDFVEHSLDNYLEYIPEYQKTIADSTTVYLDAAESCFKGGAIPAAKLGNAAIIDRKMHVMFEETGKDWRRLEERVLPPFVDNDYRVTVVYVDADPEVAITRAAGRFQETGRCANATYVRGTFATTTSYDSFRSYAAVKAKKRVAEAVYCNNRGAKMRCYADSLRTADAIVPLKMLEARPGGDLAPLPISARINSFSRASKEWKLGKSMRDAGLSREGPSQIQARGVTTPTASAQATPVL